MISKSTIGAIVLVAIGLASPAFAQVPRAYYYGYAAPYANEQPEPFGWAPYGYGGWSAENAASINYNIHTPPNH